jgi:hypothetical protein
MVFTKLHDGTHFEMWDTLKEHQKYFFSCSLPRALKECCETGFIFGYFSFKVLTASLIPYWQLAQKELQKINMYKAPRDKLVCILNCCRVISNLLLNASIASNENPPGADEFLPVLIFVTLKVR